MDEHATAEMGHRNKEGQVAKNIIVTVNPGTPKADKEVPCQLQIAPPQYGVNGTIWIDPTEEYNIVFNLPAGGPRTWDMAPDSNVFCNRKGQCPATSDGTNDGFNVTARGPNAIAVNVPPQGQADTKAIQHYRMNFDSGYSCDQIIVVGRS